MTGPASRPSFSPQSDVYPKGPRCLPSLPTTHYPPTTFLRPLFSYCYKSLFPPPFSFHIHTKPRGRGIFCALSRHSSLATRHFPFVFIILRPLWLAQNRNLPCNRHMPQPFSHTPWQ